ncbi:hypothetical protein CR513_43952, partial [Mucuna pruriens]
MDPILDYLQKEIVSNDPQEARKLWKEASRYVVVSRQLYRRGFSYPLLKCLDIKDGEYVIKEMYKGICGTHIGGRALTSKIARKQDTVGRLSRRTTQTSREDVIICGYTQSTTRATTLDHLTMVVLYVGVHILGLFPLTTSQIKFLIVAIDYFTKLVEAEPVATITVK